MNSIRQKTIGVILLGLLLWAAFSLATYLGWIHGADHRDFYPWWAAARLHFFQGLDPYALDTTRQMQLMLYGHVIPPNMDQQGFAYPAQLLVLLFPFWFIPDVEIATAVWSGLSVVLLIAAVVGIDQIVTKTRPAYVQFGLLLWQYPLLMLFQAQITALPLVCLIGAFWAYQQKKDVLAGILFVPAIIKPDLAVFSWILIFGLALKARRLRLIGSFCLAQVGLLGASLLAAGWWIPGWLASISRYSIYAQSTWVPGWTWQVSPVLPILWIGFAAACVFWLRNNLVLLFGASVALSMLLLPHTPIWNLTMLLLPLSLAWQGRARWLVAFTWLLGWVLFPFPGTWQVQYLVFPLLCLGALALANREAPQAAGAVVNPGPAG